MSVKLLTEYHLEFLSLTGGFTGSSESTHVKMPHCWKSHVTAHDDIKDFSCPAQMRPFFTGTCFSSNLVIFSIRMSQESVKSSPWKTASQSVLSKSLMTLEKSCFLKE